jgi:O-antigen/teichoic acid export membrane protein
MPVEVAINWAKDRAGAAFEKHAVLVQNSGALAIASVGAAFLGFIFWWLAARSFPPEVIGKASAFISLMAFIGLIGDGGLGTLLVGEIIRWPGRKHNLISAAVLVSLSLSLVAGAIGLTATELVSNLKSYWIDNLLLLIGCGLTGLSIAVDAAFVGMLQSTYRMLRQFSFSVFKLILIPVAALLFSDVTALLFVWVVALVISLSLAELSLRYSGRSLIHRPDFKLLWTLKRKSVDYYMLDLGNIAPGTIMPYLVAVLLSPASNAAFTMIWMVVSVALVIPGSMATVLFPAIRSEPHQYRDKMLLSLVASLLYATICSGLIFLYSKEILTIFNPAYAVIGDEHLRLLGVGMFGAVIKFHVCTAARLRCRWCLGSSPRRAGDRMGDRHDGRGGRDATAGQSVRQPTRSRRYASLTLLTILT